MASKLEIENMQEQLHFAREELSNALEEVRLARQEMNAMRVSHDAADSNVAYVPNITSITPSSNIQFDIPKNSKRYIPETAYLKGILLGGINVSTAMGSSAEPVPVIIRVTDMGNLPKDFDTDLRNCRILGSAYGDLSSERAVIRLETMSCEDKTKEEIITTKIAGIIFGDDGMNGIKGKVVQTSNKHIKNAILGGVLSGFAQNMKGGDAMSITSLGVIGTKKKGISDMARDSTFTGASNAAEKIADYYLKQAESMSPILLISGGSKVDIVFTKGVYLGQLDTKDWIERDRKVSGDSK
jgi:hypothetical protein